MRKYYRVCSVDNYTLREGQVFSTREEAVLWIKVWVPAGCFIQEIVLEEVNPEPRQQDLEPYLAPNI